MPGTVADPLRGTLDTSVTNPPTQEEQQQAIAAQLAAAGIDPSYFQPDTQLGKPAPTLGPPQHTDFQTPETTPSPTQVDDVARQNALTAAAAPKAIAQDQVAVDQPMDYHDPYNLQNRPANQLTAQPAFTPDQSVPTPPSNPFALADKNPQTFGDVPTPPSRPTDIDHPTPKADIALTHNAPHSYVSALQQEIAGLPKGQLKTMAKTALTEGTTLTQQLEVMQSMMNRQIAGYPASIYTNVKQYEGYKNINNVSDEDAQALADQFSKNVQEGLLSDAVGRAQDYVGYQKGLTEAGKQGISLKGTNGTGLPQNGVPAGGGYNTFGSKAGGPGTKASRDAGGGGNWN
jgi:hypothetical protein